MQLTPEKLTDIFDNAVNKSRHVNQRFARVDAMRLVMETIGILAKIDEEAKIAEAYRGLSILAPREGGQAAGGTRGERLATEDASPTCSTPAAPALVCEWTGISEMGDIVHYTTKHGVTNDLNMWRRDKTCAFCNLPIKFTEAQR